MTTATLPPAWRRSPSWLLGPVADELGPEWSSVPAPDHHVALGWQGLLRNFRRDGLVRPRQPRVNPIVRRADLVVASVDDLPAGTPIADLRALLNPNGCLALTMGSRGGVMMRGRSVLRYRAVPANEEIDGTGAGDVFMAGLMAARVLMADRWQLERGIRLAAAAAACSVEGSGLAAVPTASAVAAKLTERLRANSRAHR